LHSGAVLFAVVTVVAEAEEEELDMLLRERCVWTDLKSRKL
jgi:hypothetical protein